MRNLNKKANILILLFIIFNFTISPFFGLPLKVNNLGLILNENIPEIRPTSNSIQYNVDLNKWENIILRADQNGNGIHDRFDNKLDSRGRICSLYSSDSNDDFPDDNLRMVIQFPEGYDYSPALKLFEINGGTIKYRYNYAINGFSGSIDFRSFEEYYNQLKNKNIPFFIEEDGYGKTHLYYTSRNLRLRPHVWDTMGYTGDNKSSIAILDTGIDEDHKFFDNSTTGKVLKFVDFVNGLNDSAYDDNGHGTHVAGIAAGLGISNKDAEGRTVATNDLNYDLSDYWVGDGSQRGLLLGAFNIDSPAELEIECTFNDSTPLQDYALAEFWLVGDNGILSQIKEPTEGDWKGNLTYDITSSSQYGDYYAAVIITFKDGPDLEPDWCKNPNITAEAEIHWPFSPPDYGSGGLWKGVAPDANLVVVKVFDQHGGGTDYFTTLSDTLMGIEWCIAKRQVYNITVMSMSFGFDEGEISLITAVNNTVENGIVAVASAGNSGSSERSIGSPADADNVITVAANNFNDQITEYSSQGGVSNSIYTIKPDITAPGGSGNDLQMFSADTNDNDGEGLNPDGFNDDLKGAQGTSMSCPVVAGAANLLIQAIRKNIDWVWNNGSTSKLVKAILLMTATETYPLRREIDEEYSPTLDRGGKDVHEGYGRLNIDAMLEAWTNNLTGVEKISPNLVSSKENSYGKHAYAGYIDLFKGENYIINLTVPSGKDYDLYLYNLTPDTYGEPDLIALSISPVRGQDETINITANYTGIHFIVAKAIGIPSPDDDGNGDGKKTTTSIDYLTIFIIIGIIALLAIVFVIILYKKGRKDYTYDFKPEY